MSFPKDRQGDFAFMVVCSKDMSKDYTISDFMEENTFLLNIKKYSSNIDEMIFRKRTVWTEKDERMMRNNKIKL